MRDDIEELSAKARGATTIEQVDGVMDSIEVMTERALGMSGYVLRKVQSESFLPPAFVPAVRLEDNELPVRRAYN